MISLYENIIKLNRERDGREMFEILDERRKYHRYELGIPVQYKNIKMLSGPLTGALTRNIGEGGICFLGNEFLSLAQRLVLTLSLPAPSRPIKIISKVAWIQKVPMGDQYRIGSQFLTMSDEDRNELKDYLEKLEVAKKT